MNNLHRELAPISDAAWAAIEEETARTLKRYLAGRRVVDVPSAGGIPLSGVGTGHLKPIAAPARKQAMVFRGRRPRIFMVIPPDKVRCPEANNGYHNSVGMGRGNSV